MTALLEDRGRKADPFKMRIEGMDCGACATKIENALKRLPGLTDIQVSYASGTLSLRLNEDRTPRENVEAAIKRLGYVSVPIDAAAAAASGRRAAAERSRYWWLFRKGRVAMASGAALIAAFAASIAIPDIAQLAFVAAALVGLLPVANRCMASYVLLVKKSSF